MKLILLGAPGAGKGTQAENISREYHIPQISTGNILRGEVKAGTELGLRVKDILAAGQLVPEEIVIELVNKRMAETDCANGYILAGFPRNIAQADGATGPGESNPPKKEGVCDLCGAALTIRADDREEVVRDRLRVYHEQTEPLIAYYTERGLVRTVAGQDKLEDTTRLTMQALRG